MRLHKKISCFLLHVVLTSILLCGAAQAFQPFVVEDIRVEGLQRISAGTVFNYLPVKVGQSMDEADSEDAIKALFKTGFFNDIYLVRNGNILVIYVTERAAISSIEIEGNQDLDNEALLDGLEQIGLAEGRVFDRSLLEKVEQELRRQYFSSGKYAVKINTTVTPLDRNRVGILIDISEGRAARIKQINIIGNEVFPDKELLGTFALSTPNIFSGYTKSDQYSKQALSADLEILRTYYLDRGYLKFQINSTQVSITPDKKDIYITINIVEGEQYKVRVVTLSGDLVVPPEEIFPLININPGDVFSRKRVTGATEKVSSLLGNQGYAFANVNTVPELDDEKHEVSLGFFIDPGHRVYVRRINIAGNTGTRDEVVRRELRQMEGGWFSAENVDRSRARISRLGYFEDVNVETQPVPGTTDQLDVNYSVSEVSSGSVSAGLGFSQSAGLLFNASISQDNVLGSGRRMSLTFNNSEFSQVYSFAYSNPYWTVDGVSRGFGAFFSKVDADEVNLADYTTDTRGADVNFGIPLNETDRFRFSLGYQGLDIKSNIPGDTVEQCIAGTSILPCSEVALFIGKHGDTFNDAVLTASWSHDSRNRALFTDTGATQSLSLETTFPGSGLEYYKIDYRQQRFVPLTRDLTLSLKGRVGYGDGYGDYDQLPFFENFFAGGTRSVRGFRDNTLGPRTRIEDDPLGGSFLLTFSSEVFFPVPFLDDSSGMRLGAFVDVGNVYKDFNAFDAGDLRYSIGLSGLWVSPLGPLSVSVALPLNDEDDDDVQNFQFNVGSFF